MRLNPRIKFTGLSFLVSVNLFAANFTDESLSMKDFSSSESSPTYGKDLVLVLAQNLEDIASLSSKTQDPFKKLIELELEALKGLGLFKSSVKEKLQDEINKLKAQADKIEKFNGLFKELKDQLAKKIVPNKRDTAASQFIDSGYEINVTNTLQTKILDILAQLKKSFLLDDSNPTDPDYLFAKFYILFHTKFKSIENEKLFSDSKKNYEITSLRNLVRSNFTSYEVEIAPKIAELHATLEKIYTKLNRINRPNKELVAAKTQIKSINDAIKSFHAELVEQISLIHHGLKTLK